MKSLDRSLQRLLKAAGQAPAKSDPAEPPSTTLQAVTIARWRAEASEDDYLWMTTLFRRAVIFSALIMILSIGWSWFQTRTRDADAPTDLAGYALTIQLSP